MRRRLGAKLLAAAGATLVASGAAWLVFHQFGPRPTSVTVDAAADSEPEAGWNGQYAYVEDAVAGLRPRRNATVRTPMLALDGTDVRETVKHRDANGFLRQRAVPADVPRVLVVGDSHVDGIVDTADNFTSLLEGDLATAGAAGAVLNAGCGYYSLWQHVLRARDLLPQHRPEVVVIATFLGNDFLDLEDQRMPHLGEDLQELPATTASRPETTSARQRELALTEPYGQAFWQGFNQALLLHREPERQSRWLRLADHAVATMEQAAAAHGARVVWMLIPPFDLVFPEHARGLGPVADEVIQGGAQRRLRDGFVALLEQRQAIVVDLEPAYRAAGKLDLYGMDLHIWRRAHRLAADALLPVVLPLLR